MPRITAKRKDYMIKDFSIWIVGKMHLMKIRQSDMADALGITQQALSSRLNVKEGEKPKDAFSYGDILTIFKMLDATDEEKQRFMTL